MEDVKAAHVGAVAEGAEEDHHFGGEIGEAGQADGSEGGEAEGEGDARHHFAESAEFIQIERAGAGAHFSGEGEERRDGKPVGEHQGRGAGQAEEIAAGDAEEDIAHVHDAGVAEHPIEFLLRDRGQADVDDVAEQEDDEEPGPMFRAFREHRNSDAEQTVEAEFFQNAGVEHGGRSGGGGIRFGRPGVKGEERDENSEPDQEEQIDMVLRGGGNLSGRGGRLQHAQIEAARGFRHAAIKQDQPEEENEAAGGEIDRDLPGGGVAVSAAPDSDEKESGNEREFVKGVEEK